MTPITVYHLKACDTCRKALKALAAKGYEITAIDVRADGVPKAELTKIAEAAGWEALLNTRSTTWRGLDETSKADMSEAKALELIAAHPTLMKRPAIIGAQITVGWTKAQQEIWL